MLSSATSSPYFILLLSFSDSLFLTFSAAFSPVIIFSLLVFFTSSLSLSSGLHHIQLNQRVMVGKDGNLYFAHLTSDDSRDDYTCNVQYLATRTILAKEPITLTVMPCEFCSESTKLHIW